MISLNNFFETCQTGDILLYSGKAWYSWIVETLTDSCYSHISMVLRNPCFVGKKLEGIYIIEAKCQSEIDSIREKPIFGTQIIPFEVACRDYLAGGGSLYYRKLTCERHDDFAARLEDAIRKVYGSPYDTDPYDWLRAEFAYLHGKCQRTDSFWCSALIAYLFVKLGFLPSYIDWTLMNPSRFSGHSNNSFNYLDCQLEMDNKIIIENCALKHKNIKILKY